MQQEQEKTAKRRGDGLYSLFYFSTQRCLFFFLTYLLFAKTSDQLGGSQKGKKNGTALTFRSILPGDLLRSQSFLGHHFLLFLLSCLSGFSFSPISQLFSFTCSLNASAHRGCVRDHFLFIQTIIPTPGSIHLHMLMIHKDTAPGQPSQELHPDPHTQLPTGHPRLDGPGSFQPSAPQTYFYFLKQFHLFIFLAVLGLHSFTWAFSSCSKQELVFIAVRQLLIVVVSLVEEHRP